ncbi:MAG: hypothetical protein HZC29_01855 [Thaumarchaeota archaeon]|nr:hypothetical protein [Nitrososphaerota archaeon]
MKAAIKNTVGAKLAICDVCRDEVYESELKDIGKHDYKACKSCRMFMRE